MVIPILSKSMRFLERWLYYASNPSMAPNPSIIYININKSCNLRCKMCDIGQRNTKSSFFKNLATGSELSVETWKKFIDDVKIFYPVIHINGTEPILYKDIFDFIRYVKKSGLECRLTTNGFLLPVFYKKFVSSSPDVLYVSIDGPREIHDKIRGVENTFENAVEGIKKMIELKNSRHKNKPLIKISTAISNFNYNHLSELVKEMKSLGVDGVHISHLDFKTVKMAKEHNSRFPQWKATESCTTGIDLKSIVFDRFWKEIQSVRKYGSFVTIEPDLDRKDLEIYYHTPSKFLSERGCYVPWAVTQISPNGDVVPLDRCMHIVMGNIKKTKFRKIWNGKRYREFRADLKKNRHFPICARCCGITFR